MRDSGVEGLGKSTWGRGGSPETFRKIHTGQRPLSSLQSTHTGASTQDGSEMDHVWECWGRGGGSAARQMSALLGRCCTRSLHCPWRSCDGSRKKLPLFAISVWAGNHSRGQHTCPCLCCSEKQRRLKKCTHYSPCHCCVPTKSGGSLLSPIHTLPPPLRQYWDALGDGAGTESGNVRAPSKGRKVGEGAMSNATWTRQSAAQRDFKPEGLWHLVLKNTFSASCVHTASPWLLSLF